jgi:hypothetical protein
MTSQVIENDPEQSGRLATRKELFGDHERYAIAAVHTQFDAVCWVVWDAEDMNEELGVPKIIRQAPTKDEALAGFKEAYHAHAREIYVPRSYRVALGWTK